MPKTGGFLLKMIISDSGVGRQRRPPVVLSVRRSGELVPTGGGRGGSFPTGGGGGGGGGRAVACQIPHDTVTAMDGLGK